MTPQRQNKKQKTESAKDVVIYCRVSSVKQTTRGDGLSSQETRCREYARYKGYQVAKVFQDDMSGSLISRPGMQAMLKYLRKNRAKPHVVIIDDVSRLARGLEAHLQLRAEISKAGGLLESPSIEFGEDSDSILVENLLASVSQHQVQKNAEQTVNRMRARTLNGYWVFQSPIGYRYKRTPGHGNLLVKEEPYASILTEALEGFASGRFDTQVEVKRFLESQPLFPKDLPNGEIRNQRITSFLTRVVYAGHIEVPNWNVPLRKGQHEGLISFQTYQHIQERLRDGAKAPYRKDLNADFPLRGFIACGDCGHPLTACWSKSKTGRKHAYYLCHHKGCESYRKSIKRDKLEGDFARLLGKLQLSDDVYALARKMFKDAWDQRLAQAASLSKNLERELAKLDKQIEQLLDRIVDASSGTVISAYEKRIAKLEEEKLKMAEQLATGSKPQRSFEELFELAMSFLANPSKLWASERLEDKRAVLKLAFLERLPYHRNEGFRTPKVSLPFKALGSICGRDFAMARPGRFELPTS